MKNIGLYFGSFNPIHIGHLIIAEYFATQTHLNELWFIVSPHNPLKSPLELAPESDRLKMVEIAVGDNPVLKVSDIEFHLPRPSYTCDTMRVLSKNYPQAHFTIVLGEDNKHSFHLWKEYSWLLNNYSIRFFPRHHESMEGRDIDWEKHDASIAYAPRLEISSTQIRQNFIEGKSNRYLVSESVLQYIQNKKLYAG